MKRRIWFYLLLLCSAISAAETKVDVISVQRPITLQEYQHALENQITERVISPTSELKDLKILFIHEYVKTVNKKLDGRIAYHCYATGPKDGRCILTTLYYMDPDCWSCQSPFENPAPIKEQ